MVPGRIDLRYQSAIDREAVLCSIAGKRMSHLASQHDYSGAQRIPKREIEAFDGRHEARGRRHSVSDVERAKRFYGGLGWRLDADFVVGDEFRVVQFTPPGSPCSIHFGTGVTSPQPGSAAELYLIVSDIEAARAEFVARGVDVSEVFHRAGPGKPPVDGADPERRSYSSFATFSDPDGNGWLLQEVTARLPGRVDANETTFASSTDLASCAAPR